jgi:hypothetical protein
MFHALRSLEKGKSIGLSIDGDKIWEVTKEYSQTTYDPDISCVGYAIDVYQDSINKTIKEYLVNFTYFTELMKSYGFELLKRDEAVKLGIPNSSGLFSELFTFMESEIQQDPKQKSRYGSAPLMTPKEKQISFYNRYFVFKKIASVDVEDVFQSVTGVHVFQEKMNRKDTLAAQMVASQMMLEEGESAGVGKGKMSYRPTKESDLKLLGEKGTSLGLSAAELEGADTKFSKLFGSKAKESSSKGKAKSIGAEAGVGVAGVKGYSDKDLEKLDKSQGITLKKKSALSAVKLPTAGVVATEPGAAAAIIEKSKLGMKESSSKLSAEKAKSAKEEKEASAAMAATAASEADKPKDVKEKKTSSSKIGSIKLNPSALALLSGKPPSSENK